MLPAWSIAIEPIQRYAASGGYVPCWKFLGFPFGLRSSYQRSPTELPAVTLWLTTSDSWSPKLRYARRYIRRSPSESSCWLVLGWGMQTPPLPLHAAVKPATGIAVGVPLKVEFAGVAQSTWNFHSSSWLVAKSMT